MTLLHIFAAALTHGLFEAIPVGTDALDRLFFAAFLPLDGGQAVLVAIWLALSAAILLINGRLLLAMGVGVARQIKGRKDPAARIALHTGVCMLISALTGALWWRAGGWVPPLSLIFIATAFSGFLLMLADAFGVTVRRLEHLGWSDSLGLAFANGVGLIPGLGRSTLMVVLGRGLGYERPELLRLSWLSLLPLLLILATHALLDVSQRTQLIFSVDLFLVWLITLLSALACFGLLLRWSSRHTLLPVALLRLAGGLLGLGLLWLGLI